jgi:hypothetical protein
VPEGATVLVISEGVDEVLDLRNRRGWHFPQGDDGDYLRWRPVDSDEAIARLEALRSQGAAYLVVPRFALWWLDYYGGFRDHVEGCYRTVPTDSNGCAIFALEAAAPAHT